MFAAALLLAPVCPFAAGGQCPHCGLERGVEASLDSDYSVGADGTILSDVLVEAPFGACPHCHSHSLDGVGSAGSVWGAPSLRFSSGQPGQSQCVGDVGGLSVAEELARRRDHTIPCCDGLRPRFRIRVGTVIMDRVTEDFRVLIESTSNPIRQLNAEGFAFDWEPGLEVSLSRLAWDDCEFEFRFLGLREFSADQQVDTEGSEVRINSDPAVFAPNVQSMDSRYTSDLYGFELNWHFVTYCPFNYIAGFRYIALDEDLTAVLDADPQQFAYRTSTRNDLYGVQIGVTNVPDMPLFGWQWLTWFAKAGIYGNDARAQTILDTSLIGQVVSESPATSAVLWECGLGLDLPITDCISVQGGYSALILDRIAVASDQLQTIDFLNATGSHNRGTVMFHGANLALVLRH